MHTVARSTISRSRVLELRVPELADRHSVAELARGALVATALLGFYVTRTLAR